MPWSVRLPMMALVLGVAGAFARVHLWRCAVKVLGLRLGKRHRALIGGAAFASTAWLTTISSDLAFIPTFALMWFGLGADFRKAKRAAEGAQTSKPKRIWFAVGGIRQPLDRSGAQISFATYLAAVCMAGFFCTLLAIGDF